MFHMDQPTVQTCLMDTSYGHVPGFLVFLEIQAILADPENTVLNSLLGGKTIWQSVTGCMLPVCDQNKL